MAGRTDKREKVADFQDFFPPIFVKELRQGLRANQFVWPFIVVQVAAIICITVEYTSRHVLEGSGIVFSASMSQAMFYFLLWTVFAVVLPLTQFGALQPELMGGRNVELLLMSNLSRWQIVLGKWFVGSVLSGLMLISLIPYWLVRYLIGSVGNFSMEFYQIFGIMITNATMNAIVIGASGFRNYVGRFFMILLSALCSYLTSLGGVIGIIGFRGTTPSTGTIVLSILAGLVAMALVVVLNLQMGRAKLRLFENPLDPPSTALIVVLIICTPIMVGITAGVTNGKFGWVMVIILLVLGLLIDPGPGKKNRKWAQA